jgi:hypothetical protein
MPPLELIFIELKRSVADAQPDARWVGRACLTRFTPFHFRKVVDGSALELEAKDTLDGDVLARQSPQVVDRGAKGCSLVWPPMLSMRLWPIVPIRASPSNAGNRCVAAL